MNYCIVKSFFVLFCNDLKFFNFFFIIIHCYTITPSAFIVCSICFQSGFDVLLYCREFIMHYGLFHESATFVTISKDMVPEPCISWNSTLRERFLVLMKKMRLIR